jgi:hypothetical protein
MGVGVARLNVVSTDMREQLFGGRRRLRLVPLAIAVALAAAAPAGAAAPTANRLISPQYRAKSGDTATTAGIAVLAGLAAYRADPHGAAATWYRTLNRQYQLQRDSFLLSAQSLGYTLTQERAIAASVPPYNRLQIASRISRNDAVTRESRAISSGDARLLLQLGLGLGLAYVVFLAVWFWRTRNSTESAAARMVRF